MEGTQHWWASAVWGTFRERQFCCLHLTQAQEVAARHRALLPRRRAVAGYMGVLGARQQHSATRAELPGDRRQGQDSRPEGPASGCVQASARLAARREERTVALRPRQRRRCRCSFSDRRRQQQQQRSPTAPIEVSAFKQAWLRPSDEPDKARGDAGRGRQIQG
jgi:hypothetical protein